MAVLAQGGSMSVAKTTINLTDEELEGAARAAYGVWVAEHPGAAPTFHHLPYTEREIWLDAIRAAVTDVFISR